MPIEELRALHNQMENQSSISFEATCKRVNFSIVFSTDTNPMQLLIASEGANPIAFIGKVDNNYEVRFGFLGSKFSQLCALLGLRFDNNNKYTPQLFLSELSTTFPNTIQNTKLSEPEDRLRAYQINNQIEDADKIYFLRFEAHKKDGNRNVTKKNLEKTKNALGNSIYLHCRDNNISSCWTANIREKNQVIIPWDN